MFGGDKRDLDVRPGRPAACRSIDTPRACTRTIGRVGRAELQRLSEVHLTAYAVQKLPQEPHLLYRLMADQTASLTDVCAKLRNHHIFSLASIGFDHGRIHSFFSPRSAGRSCYCGHSAPAVAGRAFHCLFIGRKSVHGKASGNWKVGERLPPVSVT